jgi:hypothetical protein
MNNKINNNQQDTEHSLSEALLLLDQGSSRDVILNRFPHQHKEIVEMFETLDSMESQKNLQPSTDLLKKILTQLPERNVQPTVSGKKSPYYVVSEYFTHFKKTVIVSAVALLFVAGGSFAGYQYLFPQAPQGAGSPLTDSTVIPQSGNSDQDLQQNLDTVDSQMSQLDNDTAAADQSLGS